MAISSSASNQVSLAAILHVVSGRELPESLTSVLLRVQHLEQSAAGLHRERAAISATSALLLAAHQAGWEQTELAEVLGMKRQTISARISAARQAYGEARPTLVVEPPPPPAERPPTRLAILRQPLEDRQWLTLAEAARHVDRYPATVRNWLARGVLPNTDRRGNGVPLYLRADLDRVTSGPHRGPRGKYPDFAHLLELIMTSSVRFLSPTRAHLHWHAAQGRQERLPRRVIRERYSVTIFDMPPKTADVSPEIAR